MSEVRFRGRGLIGVAALLATRGQRQQQQQQEQERANLESQIKNEVAALKLVETEFGEHSSQASELRLKLIRKQVGGPDLFAGPEQPQVGPIPGIPQRDFSQAAASQAGRTASTQRNLERQRAFQRSRATAAGSVAGRAPEVARKEALAVVERRRKAGPAATKQAMDRSFTALKTDIKNLRREREASERGDATFKILRIGADGSLIQELRDVNWPGPDGKKPKSLEKKFRQARAAGVDFEDPGAIFEAGASPGGQLTTPPPIQQGLLQGPTPSGDTLDTVIGQPQTTKAGEVRNFTNDATGEVVPHRWDGTMWVPVR